MLQRHQRTDQHWQTQRMTEDFPAIHRPEVAVNRFTRACISGGIRARLDAPVVFPKINIEFGGDGMRHECKVRLIATDDCRSRSVRQQVQQKDPEKSRSKMKILWIRR